jgi:heterodisulfide reductase subunit C
MLHIDAYLYKQHCINEVEHMTNDFNFKFKLAQIPGGDQVMSCYLCGTCTAGCPVSMIDADYSPRAIMRAALIGERESVLRDRSLWKCIQCHVCVAHCPQDARPADVIAALRTLAEQEGIVPAGIGKQAAELEREMIQLWQERIKALLDEAGMLDLTDK